MNLLKIFFKKTDSQVITTNIEEKEPVDNILLMNYNEILHLKRNGLLNTSMKYRMIDYVTTTSQKNTKSGLHNFDLVLTPISESEFSNNAIAMHHEGDEYFKNANINAWVIYYDIENDIIKYEWADPKNGKGVIYYMVDEFGNRAPYDFKNIMFKRWAIKGKNDENPILYGNIDKETEVSYSDEVVYERSEFYYTFSTLRYGNQVIEPIEDISKKCDHFWVCDMTVNPFRVPFSTNDQYRNDMCFGNIIFMARNKDGKLTLNNNILVGSPSFWQNGNNGKKISSVANICYNIFRGGCIGNTLYGNSEHNIFYEDCRYNSFYGDCSLNTLGRCCNANTLNKSNNNTFGDRSSDNTFFTSSNNHFKNCCSGNTFEESYGNYLMDACVDNKLKVSNYNYFGVGCVSNDLHDSMNNRFGNMCSKNELEGKCKNNLLENECIENFFGDNCSNNRLYSNCSFIDMEKDNTYNTFMGNNCYINMHCGTQNVIVHQHICGESKDKPFEREIEPAVGYNQEIIVNKDNTVEII